MSPTTITTVAGCATIMQGLSAFATTLLICFMVLMAVCTAILINWLLKKYWQPVTMFRYVDRIVEYHHDTPVDYDPATGRTTIVRSEVVPPTVKEKK